MSKKHVVLIAIVSLVLLVLIMILTASRDYNDSRSIANKEFENLLQEYHINMNLFSGPLIKADTENGFEYTWQTFNGRISVKIKVPKMIVEPPSTKIIGSTIEWENLYFSAKK